MLAVQKGQILGGSHHIPMLGMGGFVHMVEGSMLIITMASESIDEKEGHAWQAAHGPGYRICDLLAAHFWRFAVLAEGDIMHLPPGQSALFLGLELNESHPVGFANSAVWWPLPQLVDATLAPTQNTHWNHTLAGVATNSTLPAWHTFKNLEELVTDIYPTESQESGHSRRSCA